MSDELPAHRIKRLHMRSMRRGIKEMDLILSAYAAETLSGMSDSDLSRYDRMLDENDHDLYLWVSGQAEAPAEFEPLIADIRRHVAGASTG